MARRLVPRQFFTNFGLDGIGADIFRHHDRDQQFAQSFISYAESRTFGNAVHRTHHPFDLGAINILAAGNHHVLFAIDDEDIAFLVQQADIASVQQDSLRANIGVVTQDTSLLHRSVRDNVANGAIGDVHLARITSRDPGPPPVEYAKVSGGIFIDMTIHDFDMARYVVGSEIVSVYATGAVRIVPEFAEIGDLDTVALMLQHANGAITMIDNSRQAVYGYDQRVELLGSEGLLQAQNMLENTVVKSTTAGVTGAKPTYFFLERYMPSYAAEWAAFVTAITQGSALLVTLSDGIAALAMAEAATLSAKSAAPVSLTSVLG